VHVLDPFSGPGFEHLAGRAATVLGPRCLLACLALGAPVPALPRPLYTATMRGLHLCFSGLPEQEWARLEQLVGLMAGRVSRALHDGVTHLVTPAVGGAKYTAAVGLCLPIMLPTWVDEAWRLGCKTTLLAANRLCPSTFQCPPLQGLTVAVTGAAAEDRSVLVKAITDQGATYSPSLSGATSALVCCPGAAGRSTRYRAALDWGVPCQGWPKYNGDPNSGN
jgi:topoisomerase (DNA) II binding protein 1